jgi:hypothetical protein
MDVMLVTVPTFQFERSWLKLFVSQNMNAMVVTRLTFHAEISSLKDVLLWNNPSMLDTRDVSQPGMSVLHATPQSAEFTVREQQSAPEGTAARHESTAAFRDAELVNAEATHIGGLGGEAGRGGGNDVNTYTDPLAEFSPTATVSPLTATLRPEV